MVGAVLELLLQGPYSAGAGLASCSSASLLDATLHTDYGQLHCLRLLLLGVLALLFAPLAAAGAATGGDGAGGRRCSASAWL